MRGGIRVSVTALAMTVVTVVLVLAGIALLGSQRRILTNNLDEILQTHSRTIERTYAAGGLADPIVDQGDEDAIAEVVDGAGLVLASTRNLASQPALDPPASGTSTLRTLRLPIDESDYRLLSRSAGGVVIHTGTPIDDVEESVAALRTGLVIAIPAVAIVLGLLVWWLVGRTLRPVETIRAQVAGISGASLETRVPVPATDDEIARLARTMNAMLDRVEDASRREQRFVADASHELRSPLTRMRTELEVDLAHPATADLVATHRSVLEEVSALQRLVEDLLELARSDGHSTTLRRAPVDLDDLVLAHAHRLRAGTALHIDTTGVAAARVHGDADQLARAIRNLCDNAARHAATCVRLTTAERDGHARLEVVDDGPGIPEHERTRVFERFARIDAARHAASGGTGLGLAIARDIVERHGGTITIDAPPTGGTRLVVVVPTGDDESTAARPPGPR